MLRLYLPLYVLLFVYTLAVNPVLEWVIVQVAGDAVEEDTLGDFEGAFYLVETLLLNESESEWPAHLQAMSSRNIPVALWPLDQVSLPAEKLVALKAGELVVANLEDTVLMKVLGDTGQVVQVGPVDTVESLSSVSLFGSLAASALLLVLVDFWAWSLQRRVTHLSRVTERFGKGDLSVRADDRKGKGVGRLNQDFNRMAAQIQQLIESHKHLTNAVSHELRTPISRIRFELDFASSLNDPRQVQASLDSIAEDTQELEKLVNELLSYARFERSSLELEMECLPLVLWLRDWFDDFSNLNQSLVDHLNISLKLPSSEQENLYDIGLNKTGINHVGDNQPGFDKTVEFNADALVRVLENLVLNARRYARHSVQISLQWSGQWSSGEPQGWPVIHVDDDGPGIPADKREALLQPFARMDASRSRDTGGFGLGLAIVHQIMQRHGGRVDISDSPLGGARFSIRWPERQGQEQ